MTPDGAPLSAVADWTWTVTADGSVADLSASAAAAFREPPRRVFGRSLAPGSRMSAGPVGLFDNAPIDLPGGRFYLSTILVEDDGRQSGIATRDPLPPRGVQDGPVAGMARRVQPTVARLSTLADRLADDLASQENRYTGYSADLLSAADHLRSLVSERGGNSNRPLELDALAVRACGMVLIRAKERGITLQAPAGGRVRGLGDERATLQILANLLTNAIKYTPTGGRVGVDVMGYGEGRVAAVVWDTGPGIGPDDQARVFQDFERLQDEGGDGAGLGLGISQRLARGMGGEILMESEAGQGTSAILLLPAA